GPFVWVGTTTERFFVDERASSLPALYFVRTENAAGGLSRVSNMAGGPSRAALISFPGLEERLDLAEQVRPAKSRTRVLKLFRRPRMGAPAGPMPATRPP